MRYGIGCLLALFVSAFVVYGTSLQSEFIAFDDDSLVYDNPAVKELTPASVQWAFTHYDPELYIPLTFLSYQVDHAIAGMSAAQFARTNLLLHIANSALVIALLLALTGSRVWSFLAGMLFLVHPLNTEAVVWIAARKDLLSGFFCLMSLWMYVKYRGISRNQEIKKSRWYVMSVMAFLLGLLSKVSILLLPVVLLCIEWWQGNRIHRRVLLRIVPYGALSLLFGIVALIGKQGVLSDSSPLSGALMAARSTVFYLWKFFVPTHLSVIYPQTDAVSLLSIAFGVPVLILIALVTVLYRLHARRVWAVAGMGFCMLAPSFFNYAKGGDLYFASDRYAYLPMIAVLLIGVLVLREFRHTRRFFVTGAAIVLVCFGVMAHRQSLYWKTTYTLFSHVLNLYEETYFAHTKVATYLIDEGNFAGARVHLQRSIDIKPTGRGYYNAGIIALHEENLDDAEEFFAKAVRENPNLADAQMNLGYLLYQKGDITQAIVHTEQALSLAPTDRDIAQNLAALYSAAGRNTDAKALLQRLSED